MHCVSGALPFACTCYRKKSITILYQNVNICIKGEQRQRVEAIQGC
jgi:hypothetical protein